MTLMLGHKGLHTSPKQESKRVSFAPFLSIPLLLLAILSSAVSAHDYLGALKCQQCHFEPGFRRPQVKGFLLLREARTWKNDDKHSMAVRLILGVTRGDEGRLAISPDKKENAVGLDMLKTLGVLDPQDLIDSANAQIKNDAFQKAQDDVKQLRKELKAKRDLEEESDEIEKEIIKLEELEFEAEDKVKEIELDYLSPLLAKMLKHPTGIGCLACHADLREGGESPNLTSESFIKDSLPDGVSCEACHGPAEDWVAPHQETKFRSMSPTEKIKLGLNDLRHPAVRSNQCYSCHIGDVQQGKYIDHSWYMAGHPPLPSIEVETFARDMPRHWRYLSEKQSFVDRDKFVAAIKGDEAHAFEIDSKLPQTKDVVVGGMVALRKSVALLADAHVKYKDAAIPDFAAFDCLACHQELRTKPVITRDAGKFDPFIPGRPNISRWSFALADLAVEVAGNPTQRTAFDGQIKLLREALTRQPFGDRASTATAAASMQTLLKQLESDLAKQETTPAMAAAALTRLQQIATTELLDFHSARQTVWAMQVIATEARSPLPEALKYPMGDKLSGVAGYLQIRLPAGAKTVITDPENLPVLLNRIDAYDSVTFRKLMCELLDVPYKSE